MAKFVFINDAQQDKYLNDIKRYDLMLLMHPVDYDIYNEKGIALCALKRYEEGVECFSKLIQHNPKDHEAIFNKATALMQLNQYEEALRLYDISIAYHPKYAEAFNGKGQTYLLMEDYKRALVCFNIAISIKPDYHVAISNRLDAQNELGRFEESIKDLKDIPVDCDLAQQLFYNKARIFEKNNHYSEAIQFYDRCLSIKHGTKTYNDALESKAGALFMNYRFSEALAIYDQLIKIDPNINIIYNRGAILLKLKKYEEALEVLNKVIEMDPKHGRAHGNAGHCYFNLGKQGEAINCYDKALKLIDENDPTEPRIKEFLQPLHINRETSVRIYESRKKREQRMDDFHDLLLRFEN